MLRPSVFAVAFLSVIPAGNLLLVSRAYSHDRKKSKDRMLRIIGNTWVLLCVCIFTAHPCV